jgi:hypothetical protein
MSTRVQIPQMSAAAPVRPLTPSPFGTLQRKCACGGSGGSGGGCEECKKKTLQRRAATTGEPATAPPIVHDVLRSPGQPLDASTRAFMEPRFGHDFSKVRIHTDSRADESAGQVNALAYTVGEHIVFRASQYNPVSKEGKLLLAHELSHVLQQRPVLHKADDTNTAKTPVQTTRVDSPLLSRQTDPPYPGVIGRCRGMGVPCPAPYATHGTICRLVDCIPAKTARLPGAVSPGVCVYHCIDGKVCACVLVGTSTSAVCTFTFCDSPGQANAEPDTNKVVQQAIAMAEQQHGSGNAGGNLGGNAAGAEKKQTMQTKLAVNTPGDRYEREADSIARIAVEGGTAPAVSAAATQIAPTVQRQQGGASTTPACPTDVTFSSSDPVHVPSCGPFTALTKVKGVTWSLDPPPTAPGTSIDPSTGAITIGATQTAGDIDAKAEVKATSTFGGCSFQKPFRVRSQPVGIASTVIAGGAPNASDYGAVFDHTFTSKDGKVASLKAVGVGERFTNVPNPAAATHAITAPTNPFGGTFTLSTGTLTPGATDNWFLTAAGQLGGTRDVITIQRANINVGRFIQSASNPGPPQGLPATMTLLQGLHWYCPQAAAASRWQMPSFVTVAHSRTLRDNGGALEFVTTVNGKEQVDAYDGPAAVFNLTASPVSTPKSAAPPATPVTVNITAGTLPSPLPAGSSLTFTIIGNALGCTVAPNPANNVAAILTVGTTSGTVTVEAADSTRTNRARVNVTIT